tara:strand:- start:86 stop:223 length:138 start_codon:yes stop_codon:yes gene_type:complete
MHMNMVKEFQKIIMKRLTDENYCRVSVIKLSEINLEIQKTKNEEC